MNKDLVLISGAIVYRAIKGKKRWFLARQFEESDEWEIPKIIARRAESSARAAMRLMLEQGGGMDTQVLEEAGRAGGSATINGKVVPQRHLYYIMLLKEEEEGEEGEEEEGEKEEKEEIAIMFEESGWFEYAQAVRKLRSKRERLMIKQGRKELRKWEKAEKAKEQ
jgi:hypothetical protein